MTSFTPSDTLIGPIIHPARPSKAGQIPGVGRTYEDAT